MKSRAGLLTLLLAAAVASPALADGGYYTGALGPRAAGPWKIDWSQVTKDNFGQTLDFSMTTIDKVEVGFFQGKQPAAIQADFLNVEQDATSLYTYAVPAGQQYVDLMSTPVKGGAFPGFTDTSGTYAVAVLCSKCSVPAPVVFSILQPQ